MLLRQILCLGCRNPASNATDIFFLRLEAREETGGRIVERKFTNAILITISKEGTSGLNGRIVE